MPFAEPATLTGVRQYLKIKDTITEDDELIENVCYAVNSYLYTVKGFDHDYSDAEKQGAVMLAARLYRRRNSPDGVQTNGQEGTVYVMRTDPDVAMLLELGPYKRPKVG